MMGQLPHASPITAMSTIRWPALVPGPVAPWLALQYQLRRTERWEPERIRAHQFAQLRHLVAHAERTMPFWRQRLRAAGITSDTPLTEESWSRIPVLTRPELQDAGPAAHCLSVPPSHGQTSRASTSGSSGRPLSILKTSLHQEFWNANLLREFGWHGIDPSGKIAVIRRDRQGDAGPGKGRSMRDWGPTIAPLYATGPAVNYETRRPPREQLAWLLRENPDYLQAYPSILALLAQLARESGQKPRRLKHLFALSEVLTPETRALCQEVFGATISQNYSCEEAGYLGLQCPLHDHLHVPAETVKLEVLDSDNRPCEPGQVGRVVITPLHNFAMPLLRYELGDWAEPGPPCDCGRTLPVLRRVLGRSRNRVLLPSGEIRVAYFGGSGFNQIADLRRFQVTQTARDAIELRLVVHRPLSPETEAHIVRRIGEMLGHPFATNVIYVDDIPPSPSGKFEDFKTEIL